MKHAIHKHTHTVVVFVLLLLRFMPEAMMKCAEKSTQGRKKKKKNPSPSRSWSERELYNTTLGAQMEQMEITKEPQGRASPSSYTK